MKLQLTAAIKLAGSTFKLVVSAKTNGTTASDYHYCSIKLKKSQ